MNNQEAVIVTLDNNKQYSLVDTITLEGINYVCLANIDDLQDIIFGQINESRVTVIKDVNIIGKLIKILGEKNQA